jgi:hypothetical protein
VDVEDPSQCPPGVAESGPHTAELQQNHSPERLPASPTAVAELVHVQTVNAVTGTKKLREMRGDRMSRSDSCLEVDSTRRIRFANQQNVRVVDVSEEEMQAKRAFAKTARVARKSNREAVRHEEWLQRVDKVAKQEAERLMTSSSSGSESEPESDRFAVEHLQPVNMVRGGGSGTDATQEKFGEMLKNMTLGDDSSSEAGSDTQDAEELQQVADEITKQVVERHQSEPKRRVGSHGTGANLQQAPHAPKSILRPEKPAAVGLATHVPPSKFPVTHPYICDFLSRSNWLVCKRISHCHLHACGSFGSAQPFGLEEYPNQSPMRVVWHSCFSHLEMLPRSRFG